MTITELKKQVETKKEKAVETESAVKKNVKLEELKENYQERISEVLLKNRLVPKAALSKASESQKQHPGNLLRFLCVNWQINENKLAECISREFKVPFMPLTSYDISDEAVKSIPRELAEEYWLLPIDKTDGSLAVVMFDPFDSTAIKKIESATGCSLQIYLGLLSEIAEKIQYYYKVNIRGLDKEGNLISPLMIRTHNGKGRERRRAVRFKTELPLKVSNDDRVFATITQDICLDGLSFKLDQELPLYSTVTLQLSIPKIDEEEQTRLPVTAIGEIRRATQLKKNGFIIGAKLVKVPKEDITSIIDLVCAQQDKAN